MVTGRDGDGILAKDISDDQDILHLIQRWFQGGKIDHNYLISLSGQQVTHVAVSWGITGFCHLTVRALCHGWPVTLLPHE